MNDRINVNQSVYETIANMTEGNPGAITVCAEIWEQGQKIDPDSFHGGFSALIGLDGMGIYGSRIWVLYKDICKQDITNLFAVCRAVQYGHLSPDIVNRAIDGDIGAINVAEQLAYVKNQLPNFAASS